MPVETRYMWTTTHTVNTLTKRMLLTTRDTAGQNLSVSGISLGTTVYYGIIAYIVKQDGTKINITDTTPVAQASRNAAGSGYQTASFPRSEVSLAPTDAVLIEVYRKIGAEAWTLLAEFITEQLNAARLDPATWSVIYNTAYMVIGSTVIAVLSIGGYDSRIENFSYTATIPQHILTITTTTGGTTNPPPSSYSCDEGSTASISANPDSGYQFDHWELDGVNVGNVNPYSVVMDANHNLYAVFTAIAPPIKRTLTISTTVGGTTSPAPSTYEYDEGTVASLLAIPDSGYIFDHWELDGVSYSTNPIIVTMDADYSLTAYFFALPPPSGSITILAKPTSTTVGATGFSYELSHDALKGTKFLTDVFIEQHYSKGPAFPYEWFFGTDRLLLLFDTSTPPPGLTPEQWRSAIITKATLRLFVTSWTWNISAPSFPKLQNGQPTYPHDPPILEDFYKDYYSGDGIEMPPSLSPGHFADFPFKSEALSWIQKGGTTKLILRLGNDVDGISPYAGSGIEKLEAMFFATTYDIGKEPALIIEYALPTPPPKHNLTITATAGGTTDPTPATYEYDEGSIVSVSAIPSSGYKLDHWELDGADMGDAIPYNVTMNMNHTLRAVFTEIPPPPPGRHTLTISMTLGGSVYPEPGAYEYDEGATITVTATVIPGYLFRGWLLDGVSHIENPIEVTMDADHTLHAVFSAEVPPTPTPPIDLSTAGGVALALADAALIGYYAYTRLVGK